MECSGANNSISFSLFGYVYVLTRASFHYQSQNLIELGKNLGFSKKKSFFKIILPSARPAIVAGLSSGSNGDSYLILVLFHFLECQP